MTPCPARPALLALVLFALGAAHCAGPPPDGNARDAADAATWRRLVRDYLRGRVELKRTLLLVDARHGVKPVDAEMMKMLDEAAVGYRIVLTKADKIKASELEAVHAATLVEARKHPAAFPKVHISSAEKGLGIEELRAAVLGDAEIR